MTDRLLTYPEAMAFFGRTRSTLDRWTRAGILDKVIIGGSVYFRESDIQRQIKRPAMGRPRKAVSE